MRLLCIIDHLGSGGAQRQLVLLARGLKRRGHHVAFFVYHPEFRHMAGPLEEAGIRIHGYDKQRRVSPGVVWALRRRMAAGRYDVALSFLDPANLYNEVAALGLGTAAVVSERSAYPPGALPVGPWLLQQGHRLAAHIVVNSYHQRERMEEAFPWMQPKISTITNGVGAPFFAEARSGVENGEAPPGRPPRLLVVGRLTANKNATGLAQALARCRERYGFTPQVRWAGRVDDAKMSETEHEVLLQRIRRLGVEEAWTWLGERDDIPQLLRAHDALVHPSFREGMPNAVCEALAAARPVLASAVGDHARLVEDGVRGYLFDPHDPHDLARAMHQLQQRSPEQRRKMGMRAHRFARESFTETAYLDRYERLLKRVASLA